MTRRVISSRPGNRADSLFLPVGTVEELRRVAVSDIADKTMCLVEERGLYRYDYQSSAEEDLQDFTVVAPQVGVGRWVKFQDASTTRRADLKDIGTITSGVGGLLNINSLMTGEVPGGDESAPGILTQLPTNWVWVREAETDIALMSGPLVVYGRVTIETTVLTGELTFENGTTVVAGFDTLFIVEVEPGQFIKLSAAGEGSWAQVDAVLSNTHLTLIAPFVGNSANGPGKIGNWLVSFYKRPDVNTETPYEFPVDTLLSLQVLKSFRSADLPFVSPLYEPWNGGSVGEGGGGAVYAGQRTVEAPYEIAEDDYIVWVTGTGEVQLTEPAQGRTIRIKRIANSGLITVVSQQGTIDGQDDWPLLIMWEAADFIGDGSAWGVH